MTANAIEVSHLSVAYHANPVLWDVSCQFKRGKMTAIIGPNGAGKSTLMKTMLNLEKKLAGTIHFYPDKHASAQEYRTVKNQVAYVPQNSSVDWDFPATVHEVVLMGRYGRLGWLKRPGKADRAIADQMLDQVGMASFHNRQISQLSGGQRQRVFLARALAQQAEIYILDEPLAGVDMKTEGIIMRLLKDLVTAGKTVIVVHHDLQTVQAYFDAVVFLNQSVIDQGAVASVFTPENITETYRKDRNLGEEAGDGNG